MVRTEPQAEREVPRRRSSKNPVPGLLAVLLFLGVVGGAVYVAIWADRSKSKAAGEEPEAEYTPFSSVDPEPLPEPRGRRGDGERKPPSPEGVADDSSWLRALEIAERGWQHTAEASDAQAAGDQATYREKASAAKKAFDEAFTLTAAFEEALVEKHGERDRQVREIIRTRNKWMDKMRLFHKTAHLDVED